MSRKAANPPPPDRDLRPEPPPGPPILGQLLEALPEITLRDFFAGCAMAGMLAGQGEDGCIVNVDALGKTYRIADVMLAAKKARAGSNDARLQNAAQELEQRAEGDTPC